MSMILPNPVFEGSEKRIEVDFEIGCNGPATGLRALSRDQLDELMTLAHCTIVSSRSNTEMDAYVLSESSLFVYPTKWVLKTCGTTRLLNSVSRLLELARSIGLEAIRCKYTRASYLFPEQQHFPHTSYDDEVTFLDSQFSQLHAKGRQAYVLGEDHQGLQWHVYIAGAHSERGDAACQSRNATFNLEVCMTELGEQAAKQFFRTEGFVSSAQTTKETGIANLKPNAVIDDYVFEPCGYSMNGIEGSGFITIHVTPEMGFSYASVEMSGHIGDMPNPHDLLCHIVNIFHPGKVSLALSTDNADAQGAAGWGDMGDLPNGYCYAGVTCKKLECGGKVAYYTMADAATTAKRPSPASPNTVLHHTASFLSMGQGASDSEPEPEVVPEPIQVAA